MKKIFFIIIIAMLMGGCSNISILGGGLSSNDAYAYNLYSKANDNLKDFDSYELDNNMNFNMAFGGNSKNIGVISSTKSVNADKGTNLQFSVGLDENSQLFNVYYKEGTVYASVSGAKVKANIPSIIMNAKTFDTASTISKNLLISSSAKSVTAGTEVNLVFSSGDVQKLIGGINTSITGLGNVSDVKAGNITIDTIVDNSGTLVSQTMSFDATCSATVDLGTGDALVPETVTLSYSSQENLAGVNATEISFPSDLDSYGAIDVGNIKDFLGELGINP